MDTTVRIALPAEQELPQNPILENTEQILNDSIATEKTDSTAIKGMPQTESAEIPTNELSNASQDKPTVREQIKKQVEERTDSVSRPNGLTKIDKGESRKKTESKGSGNINLC